MTAPEDREAAYQSVRQHLAIARIATDAPALPHIYGNRSLWKKGAGLTTQPASTDRCPSMPRKGPQSARWAPKCWR